MNDRSPDSFTSASICFIAEQIGVPENELKEELVSKIFQYQMKPFRAYLARIKHSLSPDINIALCIYLGNGGNTNLASDITTVFRRMFNCNECLDIVFINSKQELALRKVCCPFFTSDRFDYPDFYLTSSEGYSLEAVRACYKERRFINGHSDGYMLCEIDPPLLGQAYGLSDQNLHNVVLASRHIEQSIFTINEWPAYVHVAKLKNAVNTDTFTITDNDIESIGWAEIYDSSPTAKTLP